MRHYNGSPGSDNRNRAHALRLLDTLHPIKINHLCRECKKSQLKPKVYNSYTLFGPILHNRVKIIRSHLPNPQIFIPIKVE